MVSDSIIINSMFDFKHKKLPQLTFSFFYAFQPSAAQRMLHPFLEQRSIAFANAAAAITVSRRGALTSIPTEAEVTALISGTDNG